MPTAPNYFPNCFVCGAENPAGLHIPFSRTETGESRAVYHARPEHVGWPEIIHGGLLFTLMDEAVAWAVIYAGLHGVTGKAEARFRKPARVGVKMIVIGRITESSRRAFRTHAEIREESEDGPVVAEMDALMAVTDIAQLAGEVGDR